MRQLFTRVRGHVWPVLAFSVSHVWLGFRVVARVRGHGRSLCVFVVGHLQSGFRVVARVVGHVRSAYMSRVDCG